MSAFENSTIGKYDLGPEIGRGNMATVYLAHDSFHQREVAIKVANPEMLGNAEDGASYRRLFFNEAKVAGMIRHPNTVAIYDAGVEDDVCYIAMEYVRGGRTLAEHCKADRLLGIEDVSRIVFKCAKALDHAHRKGVVHRDVKPNNILLTEDGEVKLADFGIALLTRHDTTGTQVQGAIGSPLYMSPEQIGEEGVAAQSDIFSLGVVMYQLLTGKHPFWADSLAAITHRIREQEPVPVHELRHDVPEIVSRVLQRMLKKQPEARYRNAIDLAADLSLVFEDLLVVEDDLPEREKFNQVRDLAFFKDFTDPEIWEVIHASQWQEFAPGARLINEGDTEAAFYVLVSGEVQVGRGGSDIATLARGECFGEMGFISGEPRSASVTARTDGWVMKVAAAHVERASAACQLRFHRVFLSTLSERLRAMNERVLGTVTDPAPGH